MLCARWISSRSPLCAVAIGNLASRSGPQPWLLGSSPQSGIWAAELGLPYAFADFIYPAGAVVACRYRESFVPSATLPKPYVIVAAWALCADTDEEAHRLAASSRMAFAHFLAGTPIPVPPTEVALDFLERHPESLAAVAKRRRAIIGTPDVVRDQLLALAAEYSADEIMVVTITFDHQARRRCTNCWRKRSRDPADAGHYVFAAFKYFSGFSSNFRLHEAAQK